jgi:putative ABC transport system permease protein
VWVSAYLASDVDRQRRSYDPRLPRGMVEIESYALVDGSPLTPADRARALAALPVEQVVSIADPSRCSGVGDPSVPCPYFEVEAAPGGTACPPGCSEPFRPPLGSGLVVAGPELLELLTGRSQPAARAAMARGQVVAVDPSHLTAGQVRVRREVYAPAATGGAGAADPVRTTFTFPAHLLDGVPAYTAWPAVVVPPALAQRYGLATTESRVWATTTRMPTEREVEQARAAGNAAGVPVYVERGFVADNALTLLALLAASAVVTLGATGIATGLAAADSRPDLATLAAVGAAPRVRRVLSMAQAATVAGLGAGLGVLAGLIPAVAVIAARPEFDLVLPWTSLAATVVGVPLLAALCVGAFSRGRLPLERRLA